LSAIRIVLIGLLFSGLVYSESPPMYQILTDDVPKIGVQSEVYLGDPMVRQRVGQYKDCIIPNFSDTSTSMLGSSFEIRANVPACKDSPKKKDYVPLYANSVQSGTPYFYSLRVKSKKDKTQLCFKSVKCLKRDITESDLNIGPAFIVEPATFQKHIEYNGKSGSILRFVYREFSDDGVLVRKHIGGISQRTRDQPRIRPAFTTEFQIDLDEGNVGAYKGAVFEIHEATNATIKYSVIRHFQ